MELSKEEMIDCIDAYSEGQCTLQDVRIFFDKFIDQESKKKSILFAEYYRIQTIYSINADAEQLYDSESFKQYCREQQNKE